ncbi:FtsH protease activity modulator HflK [Sessilibacter corallicola]|uniref:Protein HflK n=1 Tax=Sessilibacter corallicola TaxID=2904075 RepID=A0ABQ0A5C3_9GAMM|nr:FtsH protease activity modulator HflK [Sessilibacter corallicola]MCE2027626.1 FtsH protease activity modulator HflK [Sessilibacter corallicola]
MAWNEPGGNNQDPWGGKRGGDGPPDLDEALKKFQEKLNGVFGNKKPNGTGNNVPSLGKLPIGLIILIAVVVYFASGIYQVNEQEKAVILRLGVFNQTKGAGLQWNPPLIDQVTKVNVTRKRFHSSKGTMLTEDLNIVDIQLSAQYVINDARDFVLNVREPELSLQQATESALRHVVGSSVMHEVLTEGREAIAVDVQARLQQYLDSYTTGILVDKVNVEESSPPQEVQAAFDDVNRAREDEERLKNEAQTYANGIIPEARGAAQRTIEEANAYRDRIVAQAEGEATRFKNLLTEYAKAPEVTRERLYIETVQQVMASSSKILVDVEGGNNMMYLPLDKIFDQSNTSITRSQQLSPDVLRQITDQAIERIRRENINTRPTRGSR